MPWFERLFGLSESRGFAAVQANFVPVDAGGTGTMGVVRSLANDRLFRMGVFSTPTLQELRVQGSAALEGSNPSPVPTASSAPIPAASSAPIPAAPTGIPGFSYHHIATQDILAEHAKHPGALFQAASQFNCLEFASPHSTPEMGVGIYVDDHTQGPACAMACAAGAVYRNYLVPMQSKEGRCGLNICRPISSSGGVGQSSSCQIDTLDSLSAALRNPQQRFWDIKGGYSYGSKESLGRLGAVLGRVEGGGAVGGPGVGVGAGTGQECDLAGQYDYDSLLGLVKVGLQRDVGVDFRRRPTDDDAEVVPFSQALTVWQVYCSALSCGYSGIPNTHWEPLARLVLSAMYEATLWAGVLNAAAGGAPHCHEVFLTFLGGGVFRNEPEWICAAIGRALAVANTQRAPITVYVCHYGRVDGGLAGRVDGEFHRQVALLDAQRGTTTRGTNT